MKMFGASVRLEGRHDLVVTASRSDEIERYIEMIQRKRNNPS